MRAIQVDECGAPEVLRPTERDARSPAAGASDVALCTETDSEAEGNRLTDGRGVDVVYDHEFPRMLLRSTTEFRAESLKFLSGMRRSLTQ